MPTPEIGSFRPLESAGLVYKIATLTSNLSSLLDRTSAVTRRPRLAPLKRVPAPSRGFVLLGRLLLRLSLSVLLGFGSGAGTVPFLEACAAAGVAPLLERRRKIVAAAIPANQRARLAVRRSARSPCCLSGLRRRILGSSPLFLNRGRLSGRFNYAFPIHNPIETPFGPGFSALAVVSTHIALFRRRGKWSRTAQIRA